MDKVWARARERSNQWCPSILQEGAFMSWIVIQCARQKKFEIVIIKGFWLGKHSQRPSFVSSDKGVVWGLNEKDQG